MPHTAPVASWLFDSTSLEAVLANGNLQAFHET